MVQSIVNNGRCLNLKLHREQGRWKTLCSRGAEVCTRVQKLKTLLIFIQLHTPPTVAMLTLLKNDFFDSLWSQNNSNTQIHVSMWVQLDTKTKTCQNSSIGGCLPMQIFWQQTQDQRSQFVQYEHTTWTSCWGAGVSLCASRMSWSDKGKRLISQQCHLLQERWGTLEATYRLPQACPWQSYSGWVYQRWSSRVLPSSRERQSLQSWCWWQLAGQNQFSLENNLQQLSGLVVIS